MKRLYRIVPPLADVLIAGAYNAGIKIAAISVEHGTSEQNVVRIADALGCPRRRPDISARLASYHQRRRVER